MTKDEIDKLNNEKLRKALASPYRTLADVASDVAENFMLREATAANDRAHGYLAQYGEDGYVEYSRRNKDWQAVETLISAIWESRQEYVEERAWALGLMLNSLHYSKIKKIADIINEEV